MAVPPRAHEGRGPFLANGLEGVKIHDSTRPAIAGCSTLRITGYAAEPIILRATGGGESADTGQIQVN